MAGHKQTGTCLGHMEDKFLMQAIHKWTGRVVLLHLLLINEEEQLDDVKFKGSLACSDHETVELKFLRGLTKTNRRITAPNFRRAHLNLSRDLPSWQDAMGNCPGEQRVPGELANLQGQPPQSTRMVLCNVEEKAQLEWKLAREVKGIKKGISESLGSQRKAK